MSHVVTVETIVTDLECLEKACADVGLVLRRGKKTFKWYGRWVRDYHASDAAYKAGIDPKTYGKCEHAIEVPDNANAYGVGLVPVDGGKGWRLVWDFYAGGLGLCEKLSNDKNGQDAGKLLHAYATRVVQKTVARNPKHRITSRHKLPDGTTVIRVAVS